MSDAPTSIDSSGTTATPDPEPVSAPPSIAAAQPRTPIDQAKDAAKKILAAITGRK